LDNPVSTGFQSFVLTQRQFPWKHSGAIQGNRLLAAGVENIMANLHYPLWSIWGQLPILPKLFFLIFSLVGVYTLVSAVVIMVRLRSITNQRHVEEVSLLNGSLAIIQARCSNVRLLLSDTFYLFGCVFFLALPLATVIVDDSKTPLGIHILDNLIVYFAFAANVFFVFLVLHSVQWLVSCRVRAYAAVCSTTKNIASIRD
jgi:hypothetical protein